MKRKDNNRGFTLVELIIAVAILAVIVMPLISNFIQSSKMNLKGRKSLNAMNLAQDIMEGMSAYTASEFDDMIVNASGAAPTVNLSGVLLPSGTTYGGAAKDAASTDDKKIYNLSGVQTAVGNHNEYDVAITVDATKTTHKYNDEEVAAVSEIDNYFDVVCKLTAEDETDAINALRTMASGTHDPSEYKGNLSRAINIDIKNNGTVANPQYTVEVTRDYVVDPSKLTALGFSGTGAYSVNSNNLSKMDANQLPRSVYLYYEGISGGTTAGKETININNTTGEDITVYLIRTVGSTPDVLYNTNYSCEVNVVSTDMSGVSTEQVKLVSNLRHNLYYPLKNNYRRYKESSTVDADNWEQYGKDASGAIITNYYSSSRAKYKYNGSTVTEAQYKKLIFDGYEKELKNILYEVTLEIYEAGTTDKVATYTGGISE